MEPNAKRSGAFWPGRLWVFVHLAAYLRREKPHTLFAATPHLNIAAILARRLSAVGPSEILQGGRYGKLVPVGDPAAMARAISQTLNAPPEPDFLRERASHFSFDDSIAHYEELLTGSVHDTVRQTVRVGANGNAEAFSTIG